MRMDTQQNSITDEYFDGKADFDWTIDAASSVKFGAEYKSFTNDGWMRSDKVFHNIPADTPIPDPDKELVPYAGVAPYIVGDVNKTYAYIGQTRSLTAAYDTCPVRTIRSPSARSPAMSNTIFSTRRFSA